MYLYKQQFSATPAAEVDITVGSFRRTNRVTVPAIVDTGSYKTCIPRSRCRAFQTKGGYETVTTADGQTVKLPRVNVSIQIGGTTIDNVEALLSDLPHALIGRDILARFIVTFDGPKEVWSTEPPL